MSMFKPLHRIYLKVKIKSLAAESQIIRKEEKRSWMEAQRNGLHTHRVIDVRQETRAALLAYAYLRGRPITSCEVKPKGGFYRALALNPVFKRAQQIVKKYGTAEAYDGFQDWAWSSNETATSIQAGS